MPVAHRGSWGFRQRVHRVEQGQAMLGYLVIAMAVIGAIIALAGKIQNRIGTDGQRGSFIQQVRTRYEHPEGSVDDLLR